MLSWILQASNQFTDFFMMFLKLIFGEKDVANVVFSRSLRFNTDEDIRKGLEMYQRDQMKVIVGFFGPEAARSVLCQVSPHPLLSCFYYYQFPPGSILQFNRW
jgi:hypothetical protein